MEFGPTTKEDCTIDATGIINAVQGADESSHDEDAEMERWRMMHEGMEFWDDVNDWKPLTWDVAEKMGCKVITTKWVDTNKGDTSRPIYRSRLVGREMKYDKRLDLFPATPPLETLKFLCSMSARAHSGPEPYRLAVIDI